jgi:ATP-dependent Lon protease
VKEIIGQERAIRALKAGVEMKHKGFNIFATGFAGTGRMTSIKRILEEQVSSEMAELKDHCYVYNFKEPDLPIAMSLPAAQGRALKEDMDNFVKNLLRDIPTVYESSRYQDARKQVMQLFQERQKSVLTDFEKRVKDRGFEVVQVQAGNLVRPDIIPVVNGNPQNIEQLETLVEKGEFPKEDLEQIRNIQSGLEKQMTVVFKQLRLIERKVKESIQELDERFVMPVIDDDIQVLKTTYDSPCVHSYLDEVREFVRRNLDRFRSAQQPQQEGTEPEPENFLELRVNVLVDNSSQEHRPIVIELNPKYKNIFGTIEREYDKGGVWRTDFMHIKAGSLLRADGGYFVLFARDVLVEPWVWQDLKRTLRSGKIDISSYDSILGSSPIAMKPQPVDLNVKVIMIGETDIYQLLYTYDEDFKKVFKIRADFDYEIPKTKASISQYLSFVKMICVEEKLLPFEHSALSKLLEYGVRLSGNQKKLSTQFNRIADLVRESHYWATKERAIFVKAENVKKAIEEQEFRLSMVEKKLQEMLLEGNILIDTKGKKVGQLNGLTVYEFQEYPFGKPTRITAKTSLGRKGIINIEREAELSGPIHNKGIAIINGFLRERFAQDKPLAMDASITFEQSYGGVDGDSASSTEIYAILSALSGIPLRQDIAVTGSVNQNGEIQPIGGVNLKIEGFFSICKARGLTGTQGVIIPKQNVRDLMLKEEVVESIRKKKFNIYSITTIDEGIEILTGIKSGKSRTDNTFESGTVCYLANERLKKYADDWKKFEGGK